MKKLLLAVLLGAAAFVHTATAQVVIGHQADCTTLDFDVVWPPTEGVVWEGHWVFYSLSPNCSIGLSPSLLTPFPVPIINISVMGNFSDRIASLPIGNEIRLCYLELTPPYSFDGTLVLNYDGPVPDSWEAVPGNPYGIRIIYRYRFVTCPEISSSITGPSSVGLSGCPASLTVATPSAGCGPYTITLSDGQVAPPGDGPFTFIVNPLVATTYTATGTDVSGCPVDVTGNVAISVLDAPPTATCPGLDNLVVGVPITPVQLVGSGGCGGPYTFAGSMPSGLVLHPDGTIHGTPITTGALSYSVTVTDSNNNSSTIACSGLVNAATPTITTSQQPASTFLGSSISDKATVSGGFNPSGTVTFRLYNNPTATGIPVFTDTEALSGGTATSAGYTPTSAGTFYWVATYNGDSNNTPVNSGPADEPVTVSYTWSGFLNPIPKAVFAAGSTIPIKFMLTGAGSGVKNLAATGWWAPLPNGIGGTPGTYMKIGTFKYDPLTGNYVLNWSTKTTLKGDYRIKIDLGDGLLRTTDITLK